MIWEFVFLMVIMKLPIVYLCAVVYWAVRAEPHPPEYAALVATEGAELDPRSPWTRSRRRPRRPGPHGARQGPLLRNARARAAR